MNRLWLAWSARFEVMRWRERLLVGSAVGLPAVYLVYALSIAPALAERRTLELQMQKQRGQIAALEQAIRGRDLEARESDAVYRQRDAEVRRQLAAADETIKAMHRSLVPAQRVPVLLREMVARDNALQMQSLRTLPPSALMPDRARVPAAQDVAGAQPSASPTEATERGVYKHGVEITVRGSYSALHAYLSRLERSPWRMYWWRARFAADERAALSMTLTIYTLSLDRAWVEV